MGSVLILELFLLSLFVINCRLDGKEFNQIYLAQNKTSYLKHNYILHVSRITGT